MFLCKKLVIFSSISFSLLLLIFNEQFCADLIGSIKVMELDWGNMDHVQAVAGPFDYIIGTDVVRNHLELNFKK